MRNRFGLTALHSGLGLQITKSRTAAKSFDFPDVQYHWDSYKPLRETSCSRSKNSWGHAEATFGRSCHGLRCEKNLHNVPVHVFSDSVCLGNNAMNEASKWIDTVDLGGSTRWNKDCSMNELQILQLRRP